MIKPFILLLLTAIMTISATACSGSWESFLKKMERQDIAYETIHTLENSGMTREEIMAMSPEEIRSELAEIESVIQQNKVELARELLADWDIAKNDPQFVYSDRGGSTSLHLVEDTLASVKANDWGGFTGLLIGATMPVVYEIAYQPNGELLLTRYSGMEDIEVQESIITDVYTTDFFYQFTNEEDVFFSIPRVSLTDVEEAGGYLSGSDLAGAPVTAKQAEETMAQLDALLYAYLGHVREDYGVNGMNGYGIVIPEGFPSPETAETDRTAIADGAAQISGQSYYKVSYYQNGAFAGESHYINAEDPQAGTSFLVSMVDGSLIPFCYQGANHLSVP